MSDPTSKTQSVHAELIAHLDAVGWALDEHGDYHCRDQGAAMASEAIQSLERELSAARAELERVKELLGTYEYTITVREMLVEEQKEGKAHDR